MRPFYDAYEVVQDICRWRFFFQPEDRIRDIGVTGVQTCALPIYPRDRHRVGEAPRADEHPLDRRSPVAPALAVRRLLQVRPAPTPRAKREPNRGRDARTYLADRKSVV